MRLASKGATAHDHPDAIDCTSAIERPSVTVQHEGIQIKNIVRRRPQDRTRGERILSSAGQPRQLAHRIHHPDYHGGATIGQHDDLAILPARRSFLRFEVDELLLGPQVYLKGTWYWRPTALRRSDR
jgi:hypothetical protein